MKYRKKPVVIEAVRVADSKRSTVKECLEFLGQQVDTGHAMASDYFDSYCKIVEYDGIKIKTLEGTMTASIGDYIIKGVNGEFYPCKPDIFDKTYEAAE